MSPARIFGVYGLLLLVGACGGADNAAVTDPVWSAPSAAPTLRLTPAPGSTGMLVETAMGDPIDARVAVRVVNTRGEPQAGVSVEFTLRAGDSNAAAESNTAPVVSRRSALTDTNGVAQPFGWRALFADSSVTTARVVASLATGGTVSGTLEFHLTSWRDLQNFGGTSPLVLSSLPVDRREVVSVLPLGTFRANDALPSADAVLVLSPGGRHEVTSPADGLITEIDRVAGSLTLRVRDNVRVRLGGLDARRDIWVGKVVSAGETLGQVSSQAGGSELAIRVLDATTRPMHWINPDRYGARRMTQFFGRYLADSLRSEVYGLVHRASPDLDGRIDYDRVGRLVGTWFDHSAPTDAFLFTASADVAAGWVSPAFQIRQMAEIDPPAALGDLSLTFAYDAERPGQIRIAIGRGLASSLGVSGLHTVAWEDPDPAEVDAAGGVVRYRLYASDDEARAGRVAGVLLVALVDADTLRVELVAPSQGEAQSFSARAVTLVR